jgi:pimeloyl-ACP methyl ester carboxylesterase
MTSSFVSVGSARVAYRVRGEGPAVLLVNGTGGGDGHWGDLIERLVRSRQPAHFTVDKNPAYPRAVADMKSDGQLCAALVCDSVNI